MAELVSIKRDVDVSPGQAAPAVFHCSQGDVGSKIILGLLNNGTAYSIPSGVTVTIEGSESNGSIFTPISATASGSDITFYLTGEMTAVAGPAICQAVLKSGSNILGTANFTLEVESSPMGADAPPVFTDAGWTWMLNKLTTEFVPALGDNIIDAIDSKADQSDLTALSNTVTGHTGSITVLNNTVNTLNRGVTENRQNIARKLDKNQGTANAGKYLKVGNDGNVETTDLDVTTDKTLSIADEAADAKAVGDEITNLKADLNDNEADISALKNQMITVENSKVSKPITSPDGTSGQLLRSLGNGETEWSDYGVPTNAQVENAVNGWLDEHPEATTTVKDFSLTANKLVKGTLGYVMPQQFGAKGDGETDDTQALKDCIDYAMANNYAVHIPMGVYIVSPSTLLFIIKDGQSLVVVGDGQNTIIKRKDNSLVGRWSQLFTIEIKPSTSHANDVIFSNFCIDSNRRGQGEIPASSYEYEASMDISLRNGSGLSDESSQYLDRFIVDNMRFYDPVADCVNVSGTGRVWVQDVIINQMVASGRTGTRNDIGFTAGVLHCAFITNCDVHSIHFEFNGTISDENIRPFRIADCLFGTCTLGGRYDLFMSNCVVQSAFLLSSYRKAVLNACTLNVGKASYTFYSSLSFCEVNNCTFNLSMVDNAVRHVYMRGGTAVKFKNCTFKYVGETLNLDADNDGTTDHIKGYAINVEESYRGSVEIDSCDFDSVFQYLCRDSSNTITLRNMTINTFYVALVQSIANASDGGSLTFDNIELGDGCKCLFQCGTIAHQFFVNGVVKTKEFNFNAIGSNTTNAKYIGNRIEGDWHRIVSIAEPLTFTLLKNLTKYSNLFPLRLNDTFLYKGQNMSLYPEKWVIQDTGTTVTNSAGTSTTEGTPLVDRILSTGEGYGATANRPVCYLSSGFRYFDTDLGKPIFWNGTGWVDSAGVAV